MKYAIIIILFFTAFQSKAQTDSADKTITVQLPVKGIVLYASNISDVPSWAERKTPDVLLPLVGSGTKPDSLVTIVVKSGTLFNFIQRLMSERFSTIDDVAHSIFNNSPAITGYTGLFAQITSKANGNTAEKAAATYLVNRYNAYNATLISVYNQMYQKGLEFIRN